MPQVNEFSINLPMVGASAVGAPCDVTASTTLPPEVNPTACDHINVYVDSAQITSYDASNPAVMVDLVLSVGITNPDSGACSTYKIVKRLSLDKCKLACEAEGMTPQVVEDLEEDFSELMEAFYAARRAREVAGISESAGNKTADVLVSYDDPSGSGRASTTLKISAIKDKAHAKHVFDVKTSQTASFKSKYKNAKITRITVKD